MDMEEGEAAKSPLLVKEIELNHNGEGSTSPSSSPVTSIVVFSLFVVYCGSFALGNIIGYASPAESGIINELGLSLAEYSTFVSISIFGFIFGTIWTGQLADFVGRRSAIVVSNLFCIIGWLAVAFAKDSWCLNVGRFIVGFGLGLAVYAGNAYVSEITPKNLRGAFMSVGILMASFGKAFFFLIGSFLNWRILALIGAVPYLVQLLCWFVIPESPRWLMTVGRVEESEKALQRIRGENTDISQELADIADYTRYLDRNSENGILSLFHRKYANFLIIGLGLMVFPQFGGLSAIMSYTGSIFESAGFSSTIGNIAVGITETLTAILKICFIDKFGRRPLLLVSAAGACLGFVFIGFSFFLQHLHYGEDITPFLALSGVLVCFGFITLGLEGIPWIIALEIFPMNIKGAAGSFLNVACSIGSWINSYSFNFMFEWSSAGTFFIYAGVTGAVVLFSWKMAPETTGRSLEELQVSITHDHSPQ